MRPTRRDVAAYNRAVASYPDWVQVVVRQVKPWTRYRLADTSLVVKITQVNAHSDNTVSFDVLDQFGRTLHQVGLDDLHALESPTRVGDTG